MDRIPQQLHLFGIAELFDVLDRPLAGVVIGQDSLPDKRHGHGWHIAEIVRHHKHAHHGTERVEQRGLYRSLPWDGVTFPWKT